MKTFEEEQTLEWENVEGDVFVRCGAQVHTLRLAVRDLALSSESGLSNESPSALRHALVSLHRTAVETCRTSLARDAERACEGLTTAAPFDVEERLVALAMTERRWRPCFAAWLEARLGVSPPPLDVK